MRASTITGRLSHWLSGERHGVQPEVVAELVGEHAGELVAGQFVERVAGDDDEVAAAGERVEVVGRAARRRV